MTSDLINRIVTFLVFLVVQVLVLNHIHLFGVATPLLYVYFVLLFRRNHPKWAILMWSFFLGLCIDVFSNTPGVAAGSMTLVALFQPYVLEPFLTRDSEDNLKPGMRFFNWMQWLLCISTSTLLTVVLILVIENLRRQ